MIPVEDKLLKFATLRPRSEKEIASWLRRKKVPQILHKELFDRLKYFDLIDDKKFSMWWIDQRVTFRPKGIRALRSELGQKGVKKDIIDEALAESNIDELSLAKSALKRKSLSPDKAAGFLGRRGFSWATISKIIDAEPPLD